MTSVKLKDLEYFIGCNQAESFYYSMVNEEIYNIETIVKSLSVSEEDFIANNYYYGYIMLPALNITEAFDGFISSLNNKKVSKFFKNVDRNNVLEFWLKFDKTFHVGIERRLWNEYYADYIRKKAVTWCSDYGINPE